MSLVYRLIAFFFCFAQTAGLNAQTLAQIDLDPPQVDHIPFASGIAGEDQSFSVKAIDSQGIDSVTLFYRIPSDTDYRQIPMTRAPGTDNFTALLQTTTLQTSIEYYFLVVDVGGNRVLNGFPYEPFKRTLAAPVSTPQNLPAVTAVTPGNEQIQTKPASNKNAIIIGAVGVLVVGALLSASGGGNDSGGNSGGNSGEQVQVVVNVPLP